MKYMKAKEAQARLGVSDWKLRALVRAGQLTPPIKLVVDMTANWYRAEEVEALAEEFAQQRAAGKQPYHVGRRPKD